MEVVDPIRNLDDIAKIQKLLSENPRNLMIFNLGINSGLRVSDILKLNIKDVKNKDVIRVREKKTGKYKQFPINKNIKQQLNEYICWCEQYKSNNNDKPLFIGNKGHRLHRSQVYRMLNEACQKANINANVGTHTMRKTFGYHHYKQFRDPILLQKTFNHSSPAITLRYIGITQENIDQAYNDLSFKAETPCNEIGNIDSDVKKAILVLKNYVLSNNSRCSFFVTKLFSILESEE